MLSIVVTAQKDAEKTIERMHDALRPTRRILEEMVGSTSGMARALSMVSESGMSQALANFTEVAARHMEPLMRFQKQLDSVFANHRRLADGILSSVSSDVLKEHETIHYIPAPVAFRNYARLHPEDREQLVEEISVRIIKPRITKQRAEYPLPPGATWEKLEIRFFDGHTVKIKWGDMPTQTFDYKDMGFLNRKTNNPDMKWEMLRDMASHDGSLPVTHFRKSYHRTAKYQLAKRLKAFFNMHSDPFEPYARKHGYRVRFSLKRD